MKDRLFEAQKLMFAASAVVFCVSYGMSFAQTPPRRAEQDRQALIALENEWLSSEHNTAKLEKILASDFVHPVVTGDFLTKEQHIHYSSEYLSPASLKKHFSDLQVRLYGDVGIVNGVVVTTDDKGQEVNKTVFTDVFVCRDGRWQAINAQENEVKKVPGPNAPGS